MCCHRRHLLCFLGRLGRFSRDETPDGSQPAFAADYTVLICFITKQPSLPPSSCTRSAMGLPCGSLSRLGALRAYHVPSVSPCGEGLISTPGGHHLRPVRHEHRGVTPYLLVQASQHLALVLTHDASNDALPLTISHHPRALSALFFEVERLLCCLRE